MLGQQQLEGGSNIVRAVTTHKHISYKNLRKSRRIVGRKESWLATTKS
jgi:hypothetical protein